MGEKIRVLHIVTAMNVGGLESRLMDIYRQIDRSKFQFDFYTLRKTAGYFDEEIKQLGGRIYYNAPLTLKSFHLNKKEFEEVLALYNYNIVHSHICEMSPILLKVAKKLKVKHRIVHSRHASLNIELKSLPKILIKQLIPLYATDYYAVSQKAAYWLFGSKIVNAGKVRVIKNGINAEKYRYNKSVRTLKRKEFSISDNELVVGLVGNLTYAKNHGFLIQIFAELNKVNKNAKLVIIGSGQRENELKRKCEELSVNKRVIFLGSRNDVNELLQMLDVFVMPSIYEGLPGAAVEAQASGLPVVLSSSITKEVKITENTIFVDLNKSPKYWAEQIMDLVNNFIRNDKYAEIVRSGFDVINSTKIIEKEYYRMSRSN